MSRRVIRSANTLNIIECEGAICVSVGDNCSKYYASDKYKKQLTITTIRNENN